MSHNMNYIKNDVGFLTSLMYDIVATCLREDAENAEHKNARHENVAPNDAE